MPQNELPNTDAGRSEVYSRPDSLLAAVGAAPFMPPAPWPHFQPTDWREAFRIIAETEKAVGMLARELRASAKLDAFQPFIDRRPQVRAFLGAMHDVLSLHTPQSNLAAPKPGTALSPRERAVLRLIGAGLSNKRIARELQIAPETVKSHAKSMLAKFNAKTRAEAVALAASMSVI